MVEPFYIDTTGAWVLGHNQSQGAGSHLQAGARAELIPSPVTRALSTFGGRIAAQTMQYMFRGNVKQLLNYAAFRPYAMMEAVKVALGQEKRDKVVLDPASGFSPVYYWLANELWYTDFVEIDTPKMIDDKQNALKSLRLPKNLSLHPIDLTMSNLHDVYKEPVDVMVVNGAFVNPSDFADMLKYVTLLIKDEGFIVATLPYRAGVENYTENAAIYTRIVSNPIGAVDTEDDIAMRFKDTPFTPTRLIKLSELAAHYDKPQPMDAELIVIAQKSNHPREAIDEDMKAAAELNQALQSAEDVVPPFIEFDPESFKRFPRRHRIVPPKKLPL